MNKSKTKRDRMKVDTDGAKSLRIIDVTGDKVYFIGTTIYWVGLRKDGPKKPLKCYVTRDGDFDEILLSTHVMKKWGILPNEFPKVDKKKFLESSEDNVCRHQRGSREYNLQD